MKTIFTEPTKEALMLQASMESTMINNVKKGISLRMAHKFIKDEMGRIIERAHSMVKVKING